MVDERQPAPVRRHFQPVRVQIDDAQVGELVGRRHTPGTCSECHANTVPCWQCADGEGVPVPYPLTDEIREVWHVAICSVHGAISAACPKRTHYTRPADDRARAEPQPSHKVVRAVLIGFLLGIVLGLTGGALLTISVQLAAPHVEVER